MKPNGEETEFFEKKLANGSFLEDLNEWIDTNPTDQTFVGESDSTTIGQNFAGTTTIAYHSPVIPSSSGSSEITTLSISTTQPAPPKRANFTWDYKKMQEVNKPDEKISEKGFRIAGKVSKDWELINFQLFYKESELLLNLTANKMEEKIFVDFSKKNEEIMLNDVNILENEPIEFLFQANTLTVNGKEIHSLEMEKDTLEIKIFGDIDPKTIEFHPIYNLPLIYKLQTSINNESIDAIFNDSDCVVLSIAGKVNNKSMIVADQDFYIDLIHRYQIMGGYLEDVMDCYELDVFGRLCDVLLSIQTNLTNNLTSYDSLQVYWGEADYPPKDMYDFDKKWIGAQNGTAIFQLGEEFRLQLKICNRTNYLINVNGEEVKKYSVEIDDNRPPKRFNMSQVIRIHTTEKTNFDQVTLYGLPSLTKEENG